MNAMAKFVEHCSNFIVSKQGGPKRGGFGKIANQG